MTKQEEQIPYLLTSHAYMMGFFAQRIREINPQADKLLRLESHEIKAHRDKKFFHYVIMHQLTLRVGGLRKRYIVLSISFSGHKRKKMYQTLELAYQHGFAKGNVIVPRPLWYIDELMAAFYIGVPGDNLLEHIKNGYLNLNLIKKIAEGLAKFHQLAPAKSLKLKKHSFSPIYLDPTNVIGRAYNQKSILANGVLEQYHLLKKAQHHLIKDDYLISHGDFHPENVIINKFNNNQIVLIDFSEVCLAPVYFDIGSFLQQLEFMTLSYLSNEQHKQIEYTFLTGYFKQRQISQDIKNKINLYKGWTALKSVVYFMIFEDETNRHFAKYLLARSEDFYQQIKLKK